MALAVVMLVAWDQDVDFDDLLGHGLRSTHEQLMGCESLGVIDPAIVIYCK